MLLETLRSKAKGIFAWFILGIIFLAFMLSGVLDGLFASNSDIVAKIDGKPLYQAEVTKETLRLISRLEAQNGSSFSKQQADMLRSLVVSDVIERRALSSRLIASKLTLPESSILSLIRNNSSFHENGYFNSNKYVNILSRNGFTDSEYRSALQLEAMLNNLQANLGKTSFLLPGEAKRLLGLEKQLRDFSYFRLKSQALADRVVISPEKLQEYYTANKSDFYQPRQLKVEYLELKKADIKAGIAISDTELHDYYKDNLVEFTLPKRVKLQQFVASDVATLSSLQEKLKNHQPITADSDLIKGGVRIEDLNWVTSDMLDESIWEIVADLSLNDYSESMEVNGEHYIFKLVDSQEELKQSFAEVKDKIFANIQDMRATEKFTNLSEDLSTLSFENPENIDYVAKQLGLAVKQSDFFTLDSGTGIFAKQEVRALSFSPDILDEGFISEIITLAPEHKVVVRKKQLRESTELSFIDAKDIVTERLVALEVDNLRQELMHTNDLSLHQLASKHQQDVTSKSNILRIDNTTPEIVKYAFKAPVGTTKCYKLANGDLLFMHVSKCINKDLDGLDSDFIASYRSNLAAARGQLEYSLYKNHVLKQADVVIKH